MADLSPQSDSKGDTGDDTGLRPEPESTADTPRWVYVFGTIFIILVLLFVILHLTDRGLGGHTP